MSKAFDTVHIHNLISKLTNTNIPPTIIKYIANYIKGRKAYTTYNNTKSPQKQIKTGVPQGGVLSPTLFNIYTSDIPIPQNKPEVSIITYADDITCSSTHVHTNIATQNIQPPLEHIKTWANENNLQLNAHKTTTTLFTPDPAEHKTIPNIHINNTLLPHARNPKILGLTLDTQLTYTPHINIAVGKARKTINILKAISGTQWGKQKETIIHTYKAITRPILEYASTIWSPIISDTNIQKLQAIQNAALRIATGCTRDTSIQHLHDECSILPIKQHLILHASQLRHKAHHPTHPLHTLTQQSPPPRLRKPTIFNHTSYTHNIQVDPTTVTHDIIKHNIKQTHTHVVQTYISSKPQNKLLNKPAPRIHPSEQTLPRTIRRALAQIRTNKSPLLLSYLHKIDPATHPNPLCTLCHAHIHDAQHIFRCSHIPTSLVLDLENLL